MCYPSLVEIYLAVSKLKKKRKKNSKLYLSTILWHICGQIGPDVVKTKLNDSVDNN